MGRPGARDLGGHPPEPRTRERGLCSVLSVLPSKQSKVPRKLLPSPLHCLILWTEIWDSREEGKWGRRSRMEVAGGWLASEGPPRGRRGIPGGYRGSAGAGAGMRSGGGMGGSAALSEYVSMRPRSRVTQLLQLL